MAKVDIKFNNQIMDRENIEKLANAINDTNEPETIVGLIDGQDITPDDINATGKITGDEIVENMSGYSFTQEDDTINNEFTPIYAGVCKNGNKITFVYFVKINTISATTFRACAFYIPSSVGEKLYPTSIGGDTNKLLYGEAWFASSYNAGLNCKYWVDKESDTKISIAFNTAGITANTTYSVRVELTFLLTDNLIGE